MDIGIEILKGKVLREIRVEPCGDDRIYFETEDDETYRMFHRNDCCESVGIQEIHGDLKDLIGEPILLAEAVSDSFGDTHRPREDEEIWGYDVRAQSEYEDSWTWTFYKLATIKGSVTIRWYGSSNGYYSESVDFEKVE